MPTLPPENLPLKIELLVQASSLHVLFLPVLARVTAVLIYCLRRLGGSFAFEVQGLHYVHFCKGL